MFRHNVKIALRNILKQINYSILNVIGLGIGLASFIFIMLYVSDELKYDKYHHKADRLFRVNRLYNSNDINEDAATCSFPFAPALQEAYPHLVKSTCRFFDFQRAKLMLEYRKSEEEIIKFNEEWFYVADSTAFSMFGFELLEGNPSEVLSRPNTIVLSESSAKRYFGNEPAIGKTLLIEEAGELEVSGIMKDLPKQSHFSIDMIASMASLVEMFGGELPQTWIWNPCWTYVELAENIKPEQLESQFDTFYLNHYTDFQNQEVELYLQSIKDIHLHSKHEYEMQQNASFTYIKILSMIAFFVLVLAIINFMNLSTASSSGRAKEIGLKKVHGAKRASLIGQFLSEAIIQTFFALLLAIIVVELLLPYFNLFTEKDFSRGLYLQPFNIAIGAILLLVVGVISGSYPAFYLSGLDSSQFKGDVLKGTRSGTARKVLVIVQFFISIALIIGSISSYKQLKFMQVADLGFNRDQIIILPSVQGVSQQYASFVQELKMHNEILNVTGMEDILGVNHNTRQMFIEGFGEEEFYYYPTFVVRHDFLDVFDIEVIEGRAFSRDFPADTSSAIMINESMAKELGWTNEEAIGKRFRHDGDERVIGIFKDFHAMSLHKPVNNFVLDIFAHPGAAGGLTRYIAIKVNSKNYSDILEYIEETWYDFAPSRPFEYFFFDDRLDELYKDEQKLSSISIMITLLAIIIAGLGLIGLTSFMVEQRTKEICVRRIHGASFSNINHLLSTEFIRLISISVILSWPLAYFAINKWLNNFAQRTSVDWLVFIISGVITFALVSLVSTLHAKRAISLNAAEVLKYE